MTLDQPTTAGDVDEAAITAPVSEKTAVDNATATTIAVGGATNTPTADDLLSQSSREVHPGEASLLGLSHVLIPVSTMKLFFLRFDMLQRQLDELKSLMTNKEGPRSAGPEFS